MKVLVVGDRHGSVPQAEAMLAEARRRGADCVLQVGDFGYVWGGSSTGLRLLDRLCAEYEMPVWWLDGNHEDFVTLKSLGADPDGPPVALTEWVRYLPRGCRFMLGSLSCMAFGGATSVDADSRVPMVSWFPDEEITTGQTYRADGPPVDVLFTHDSPYASPRLSALLARSARFWSDALLRRSYAHRVLLGSVFDTVKPKLVVHGHYHFGYRDRLVSPESGHEAVVIGLDCHDDDSSWLLVDSESLSELLFPSD